MPTPGAPEARDFSPLGTPVPRPSLAPANLVRGALSLLPPFGNFRNELAEFPIRKYLLDGRCDQSFFQKLHEPLLFRLFPFPNTRFGVLEELITAANGFHEFIDALALGR